MKKLYLNIFTVLISFVVYCQSASTPEDFIQSALNFSPVSPEASSLGKYGDIPVNLAVGKINYTVPLYTIKLKDFEWPIYLSYNYSGLLVEQDPSTLGLGWDMMANGRINREIRGIPDELDRNNFMENYVVPYLNGDYDNLSFSEQRALKFFIYNNLANRNFSDGQYDKFYINAGALGGSYYLKNKTDAIFSEYKNYLVSKVDSGFIITDDNGVKYFFEESEEGVHKLNLGSDSGELYVPISYLLTKIELPTNGGEIIFEYAQSHFYGRTSVIETNMRGLDKGNRIFNNESIVEYKPLEKIVFPNGEVNFVTSGPYLQDTTTSFSIEEVKVESTNNEIIKYQFIYDEVSKNRKLLKKIVKTNNNNTEPFYTFNYNNEGYISDRINYTAQDFWGYYNNKGATNLHLASREIDSSKTIFGALQKITYPTGGYSEIHYEQNKLPDINNNNNCDYSHNQIVKNSLANSDTYVQENLDIIINVEPKQIVYIEAHAEVSSGNANNAFGAEAEIHINFIGHIQCANAGLENSFSLVANVEKNENAGDRDHQSKSQYSFTGDGKIHISGYISPAGKEASIEYLIRYEELEKSVNTVAAGIRVAATIDCNKTSDCVTTNYKYILEDGITSSGLTLGGNPTYSNTINYQNRKIDKGVESGSTIYTSSRSKQPFTSYQGAAVLYSRVESYRNNGETGKNVTTYSVASDIGKSFPFAPKTNNNWLKGKVLTNYTYQKSNSEFILVRKDSMFYEKFELNSNENTIKGLAVGRNKYRYSFYAWGLIEGDPLDYKEGNYIDSPKDYKVTKKESNQYFDSSSITVEESYTYNNNLILSKTETINSNGEILKVKTKYPHDVKNQRLIDENRISIPLKVESFKDTLKLSSQNITYIDFGGNYLPQKVQTSKNLESLEDRLIYHSYDAKGNPIEVSKKDGTHIVYIWGYNQTQPIAKIENATYSEVEKAIESIPNTTYNSLSEIQNLSNLDKDIGSETYLRTALNDLRNVSALNNAQVTTFTYDPLIGVTSVTDSRGETIYYHYDSFNRLEFVKDADGNILSKNEYNYKN